MMPGVAVVGLGKIGLPLAAQIAGAGLTVRGVDADPQVARLASGGEPPLQGEPGLAERLSRAVQTGRFTATTDTVAAVRASGTVIIVVPLVIDSARRPDFSALDAATGSVAAGLQPGTLVIVETTVPVHTTRQRIAIALAQGAGLQPGRDFSLCYSPERVSSGSIFADLARYPKLVGGIDPASGVRAAEFYASVLRFDPRPDLPRANGVWDLGCAEAAELTKLAETIYRDVNIALANEFARFAQDAGLDVFEVIEAANSQPYSHVHRPGIAVGGHCIPVYPWLYAASDPAARLPVLARQINDAVTDRVVDQLAGLMAGPDGAAGSLAGQRVVVLGAAYRGGARATAFSGVHGAVRALTDRGATPLVHDPLYSDGELAGLGFEPYQLGQPCDAAIVQADHPGYASLTPADLPGIRAIVDGRAITDPARWDGVPRQVLGIGRAAVLAHPSSPPRPRQPPGRIDRACIAPG